LPRQFKRPNGTLVVGLLDGALFDKEIKKRNYNHKKNSHNVLHLPFDFNSTIKM
jgi:hypothetical protein